VHPLDNASFLARLIVGGIAGMLTWFVASDAGDIVLHFLRVPQAVPGRAAIAAAIGYAIIGTLIGALGLAHVLSIPLAAALLVLASAMIAFEERARVAAFPQSLKAAAARLRGLSALDKLAVGAFSFAIVTAATAAALPAVWWDPIAYHLPIVVRALAQHAFSFDPRMVQTGFPLLAEAAAIPAYAIGGSAGAAFATLGAGIALARVSGAWADSIAPGSGRLATALVACSALWVWLAPSFYVDIPFALFVVGSFALPQLAKPSTPGTALAAGVLAGAAAATKYPGLVVVVLAILLLPTVTPRGERARSMLSLACGALLVAAGWYARTTMQTGDILYPWIGAHAGSAFAQRYVTMTANWCGGPASFTAVLSLPWRLLTDPRSFCGDPGYALDIGAIFVIAALTQWRRVSIPAAACAALTIAWFATSQQWRFLVPAVCLFAIVAAVGATAATGRLRSVAHAVLLAAATIGVAVNWIDAPGADASNSIAPAYAYIAGAQSGDAYLSSRLEFYAAALWLRANGASGGVAALDDVRDYYFGPGVVWLNPYYQSAAGIDWNSPPKLRYAALAASGVRYLIVNANPAYVERTPTGVDWAALAADERSGELHRVYFAEGVAIDELPRGPERPPQ
jgi:hypothetical protein